MPVFPILVFYGSVLSAQGCAIATLFGGDPLRFGFTGVITALIALTYRPL